VRRIGELETRATWRKIPEDNILHSRRRENLESYNYTRVCSTIIIIIYRPRLV
jgi:hypothetical protein